MGGPSAESKANESAQTAFYNATVAQQKTTFGQQQQFHELVRSITEPIIAAGPNAYGFTPEEDALLRGEITDRSAQAEASAVSGTELKQRQLTGGTETLPTGASAELEENARILGEQSKARQLSTERLSGFEAGNLRYNQALQALSGATGNPTAYTTAATGAGDAATKAIQPADSERSNLLSTLLGGAIQGGVGVLTGGGSLSTKLFG